MVHGATCGCATHNAEDILMPERSGAFELVSYGSMKKFPVKVEIRRTVPSSGSAAATLWSEA
jgi:hypothetical protein